jgi:Mn-dependent DtxR family transcriptional regulator
MKTKTKSRGGLFSKAELKVLTEIAKGNSALSLIQKKLSAKPPLITYTIKKLQTKSLIKITRKGTKKQATFNDTKHAILLKSLLSIYDYVDWENVLKDKAIEILFQLLNDSHKPTNVSRNTFWRYMKDFKSRGIITQEGKVNPQFRYLIEFLEEYQNFFAQKIIAKLSSNSVILWQHNWALLIRTPKTAKDPTKNFHKTALSLFPLYDLPLFSDCDFYFYSTTKEVVKLEDVVLHTLLLERDNVRYSTYALLLLKKMEKQIDKTDLLRGAKHYGLEKQMKYMFEFLQTHIRPDGQPLPTWEDFAEKAHNYGVMT